MTYLTWLVTRSEEPKYLLRWNNEDPGGGGSLVKIKTHANETRLKFENWNVRGYRAKEVEINEVLDRQKINIAVLSETKKKGSGTMESSKYIVIYSGVDKTTRASVGVIVYINSRYRNNIDTYNILHERIVAVRIRFKKDFLTIVGVYVPEEGKEEKSKEFYEHLQKTVQTVDSKDELVIAGDLNAQVGKERIMKVTGTYEIEGTNTKEKRLIDFYTHA